ncbi:MAG: C10 family peptidase [Bacteroidales bacterium]
MKKIYTTALFVLLAIWLSANPVSKKLAKKIAINFLSAKTECAIDTFSLKNIYTQTYNSTDAFYVFAFPKGGFVIVSADDEANPIIGYSLTSPTSDKINPVVLKRFEWYAKLIDIAVKAKSGDVALKKKWEDLINGNIEKGNNAVGPLLQTIWNQEPYYNQLCPTGTPTGCVATAMSQIMKYYNWPTSGNGNHSYTHPDYGLQSADFENETYNWSNMPNSLVSTSSSTEKNAIATLCYHAGVSVDMEYGTDGSAAYDIDVLHALTSYFKYDPSSINIYDFDVNNQTEWINMVKEEIDAERPVFYSGSSTSDGGHAWVCDGYDNNNNFHINWGWGGYYNGYFAASAMNPGSYNFSESNSIIVGIKPGSENQSMLWIKQASAYTNQYRIIQNISAVDNNTAWAIAYDGSGNNIAVKEFTKTIDGGKTWSSGSVNANGSNGLQVAMISAISNTTAWIVLYGSSGGGMIVKTSDGGANWTQQSTATFEASAGGFPNVVYFWDENNGFCMGDPTNGYFEIYTTTNGGDTWNRIAKSNIPSNLNGETGIVGYYAIYGDIVWFSTNSGRIFKSTDKGYTWTVYPTPLTSEGFELSFKDENIGIIQSRSNNTTRSYKTTDGGQTWTQLTPSGNFYNNSFAFVPGTNILISTGSSSSAEGISYSIDYGNTFNDYADFYKNFPFFAIGASPNGTIWAGSYNYSQYYGGVWCLNSDAILSRFSTDKTEVVKNNPVIFTDQSYGNPDSWEWNFGTDASPQTATGQGTHSVTFSEYGYKTVTLTITKGTDQSVYIKENAINVTWADNVDDKAIAKNYLIYPNPVSNEIYVRIKGFERGSISVFDITGALVWQSQGVTDDDRVNISNLSSGVYIIMINTTEGSILSRKLTISR